ncbi:MAG TPA: hypothetical protein VE548_03200 [Nitrososphaeraceae archaeon]|nr:hypothetical protein [Nitrososphaeraceae archaeon]
MIAVAPRTGLPKGYQQMTLRIESLKERTEPNDGLRILIARSSPQILLNHKQKQQILLPVLESSNSG